MNTLFKPLKMGELLLPNRICMAALTRQRCETKDLVPNELMIEYYGLRAAAGFILTECLPISERSLAFPGQPGIFSKEQTFGWKQVGYSPKFGMQVWGPSPIAARGKVRRSQLHFEIPHEMTVEDIQLAKQQFKQAALNCKEAGFNGIQLHARTGSLIDQFLRDSANQRQDSYGGNVENRCKFCLEVIDELISVYGSGRIGLKISPVSDMCDSDPLKLYSHLISQLDQRNLAFIELRDDKDEPNYHGQGYKGSKEQIPDLFDAFRPLFKGVLIANSGYTPDTAISGIEAGRFDAVTFGKLYISNPDLVKRIKKGVDLNYNQDESTFYTKGKKGYLDYPLYQ